MQLVGIGDLQLVVRLGDAAERRVAAQEREQLGRVGDGLGVGVPRPPAERRHLLRAGEQLLALAQLDFGGPALGDVDDHRADHPLLAEAHRVVAGQPGAALARPGLGRAVELQAGHGLAGVAHAGDHRVDLGGQLRVEDLRQPAPQVLARGAAVDGGQRVGDEHEAQLLVVDREADRRVRLQRLDERRGGDRLLLAAHTHVATLVAASAAVGGPAARYRAGSAQCGGGSVLRAGSARDRLGGGAGHRLPRAREGVAPGPARRRRRAPDGGDQRRLRAAARGRPAGAQRAPPGARGSLARQGRAPVGRGAAGAGARAGRRVEPGRVCPAGDPGQHVGQPADDPRRHRPPPAVAARRRAGGARADGRAARRRRRRAAASGGRASAWRPCGCGRPAAAASRSPSCAR